MNRYLLFAGESFYPAGGWDDYRGAFQGLDAAKEAVTGADDWAHIIAEWDHTKVDELVTLTNRHGETERLWLGPKP